MEGNVNVGAETNQDPAKVVDQTKDESAKEENVSLEDYLKDEAMYLVFSLTPWQRIWTMPWRNCPGICNTDRGNRGTVSTVSGLWIQSFVVFRAFNCRNC